MQQRGVTARGNGCQTPLLAIQLLDLCESSRQWPVLCSLWTLSPPGLSTQMAKVLDLAVGVTSWHSFGGDGDADGFLRNKCLAFLGTKLCPCTAPTTTTAPSSPSPNYHNHCPCHPQIYTWLLYVLVSPSCNLLTLHSPCAIPAHLLVNPL